MADKRSYDDGCASARALDLVGERWALLVVRELVLGPKRFTDLRSGLPGISPNVLTQRLDELERASIVRRRKLPPPAASSVYELTPWGTELEPAIQALGRWAARSPTMRMDLPLSVDALILSLRTMFDSAAATGIVGRVELRLGEERFVATIRGGAMTLVRSPAAAVDLAVDTTLESDTDTLVGVIYAGARLADAVKSGRLKITGDKALARRFVGLFTLPARARAETPT
jgi:DNA-binding HxlR family transcriptional regulator/putative sterol carrier protein